MYSHFFLFNFSKEIKTLLQYSTIKSLIIIHDVVLIIATFSSSNLKLKRLSGLANGSIIIFKIKSSQLLIFIRVKNFTQFD